ncbi:MAG: T9SS type A sorting domain-containing protein [Melioribacteraceae bacterium]|nr:T9SS type A sorting domain-containing protein [Melioribacteraceae bacterium]
MLLSKKIFTFALLTFFPIIYNAQLNWQEINLPYGGKVTALCEDIEGNIFAASSLGIYKSESSEINWSKIIATSDYSYNCKFFVHSSGIIFCTNYFISFRFDSNGKNVIKDSLMFLSSFYEFDNKLFATTYSNKICISIDTGKTWNDIAELDGYLLQDIYVNKKGRVVCFNFESIFISVDTCKTWKVINVDFITNGRFIKCKNGSLFILSEYNSYFSSDEGESWQKFPIPDIVIIDAKIDENDNIYVGSRFSGLFITSDYGKNWTKIGNSFNYLKINSVLYTKNQKIFVGTETLGVCSYEKDNSLWKENNIGLPVNVYKFVVTPKNTFLLSSGNKLFRSSDSGINWNEIHKSENLLTKIFITGNSVYLREGKKLYESTDDGISWNVKNITWPDVDIVDFLISPDNVYYLSTWQMLFKSEDMGISWIIIWDTLEKWNDYADAPIQLFTSQNGNVGFTYGKYYFESYDYGATWLFVNPKGLQLPDVGDSAFGFYIKNSPWGNIYAIIENSLFIKSASNYWEKIFFKDHSNYDYSLILELTFSKTNYALLTVNNELWETLDFGKNWKLKSLLPILGKKLIIHNENLFISDGKKILFSNINNPESKTIINNSLIHNYPNPFNNQTTIEFYLTEPGETNIDIFNTLGERVETIVNNFVGSGFYKVNWNPRNLSSGIYFYRLRTPNFTETKKMILLR